MDLATLLTATISAGAGGLALRCWQMYREGARLRVSTRSSGYYDWVETYDGDGYPDGQEVQLLGTIHVEIDNFGGTPFTVRSVRFVAYGPWRSLLAGARSMKRLKGDSLPLKIEPHTSATLTFSCGLGEYEQIQERKGTIAIQYSHGRRMKRARIEPGPTTKQISEAFVP